MTTLETRFHESIPPSLSILNDNALSFRPASIHVTLLVEAGNNKRRRLTARRTLVRFAFMVALRVLSRAITQLPAITDAL